MTDIRGPASAFELRRRGAGPANAGRSRRDRENCGGRRGLEEKTAVAIASGFANSAGVPEAVGRQAARADARDQRPRIAWRLAEEPKPPSRGRNRGPGGVAPGAVPESRGAKRTERKSRKPAIRNDRGHQGNVGIIRSPVRALILPDCGGALSNERPYRDRVAWPFDEVGLKRCPSPPVRRAAG